MTRGNVVGKLLVVALIVLLSAPLAGGTASAEKFRLTIGAGHPTALVWVGQMKEFFAAEVKKRVEARTDHEIEWVEAYGGAVAKIGENLEAVQDGLLDVGLPLHQFEITKLFLHCFTNYVPFASGDPKIVSSVGTKIFKSVPYLTEVFEKKYNQKWISGAGADSYHLLTTFPVKTLDDLKGHKIAGAGPNLTWLEGIAVPVQSNFNEAYTSFQTGVYEGWFMYVDTTLALKLYEVTKQFTWCDFGCVYGGSVTVNLDRWNSLPKEVQAVFMEVGEEWPMHLAKAIEARRSAAVEGLKQKGMQFYTLPFEERVRWANKLPNIPNRMAKEADKKGMPGSQVFKMYIDELEKAGHKFPRKWEID